MKSYRSELTINFPRRRGYMNITGDVQRCLDESGKTMPTRTSSAS